MNKVLEYLHSRVAIRPLRRAKSSNQVNTLSGRRFPQHTCYYQGCEVTSQFFNSLMNQRLQLVSEFSRFGLRFAFDELLTQFSHSYIERQSGRHWGV
jgi:hypothetical protein